MRVNNILQSFQSQQIQKKDIRDRTKNSDGPGDRVEISTEARSLQGKQGPEEVAKNLLHSMPEIRKGRVEEAKQKLQDGFYSSSSILSKVAENLLKGFGI